MQRFENEINLWSNLKNEHILPFYGIVTDLGHHIHMVRVTTNLLHLTELRRNFEM